MRQGTIFTCEACRASGLAGGACLQCGRRTRDENGHEALRRIETEGVPRNRALMLVALAILPWLFHRDWDTRPVHLPRWAFYLAFVVWQLPSVVREWRAKPRSSRVEEIVALDTDRTMRTKVRGRVRLLDGVMTPDGRRIAAREERCAVEPLPWWKRELAWIGGRTLFRRTLGAYGDAGNPLSCEHSVRVDRLGGRYLIEDGTGVALVDDDAFELRERPRLVSRFARWLFPRTDSVVELHEGDEVEVEGLAGFRHGAREVDFGLLAEAAYRAHGPYVLVFDGRADDPVRITVVKRLGGRRATAPRAHVGAAFASR